MTISIREMTIQDYDAILALWRVSDGIGLSSADTRDNIARYLERNPGFSVVACDDGRLVGAVLGGHDGRRGFLHHLAVYAQYRRQGIGRRLVEESLAALEDAGINKCHIFVYSGNDDAIAFWSRIGWTERIELTMMSRRLAGDDVLPD